MKNYKQEHELMRRKVWADAWAAVASANDCKSKSTAAGWADDALKEFDKRFPAMIDEPSGYDG